MVILGSPNPWQPRAVLNREKKSGPVHSYSQKSPRAHHALAVGSWWLALATWRLVAVGVGLVVDGSWWLGIGG